MNPVQMTYDCYFRFEDVSILGTMTGHYGDVSRAAENEWAYLFIIEPPCKDTDGTVADRYIHFEK